MIHHALVDLRILTSLLLRLSYTPSRRWRTRGGVVACMRVVGDTDYDCFVCFLAFVQGFQFEMPMFLQNVDSFTFRRISGTRRMSSF